MSDEDEPRRTQVHKITLLVIDHDDVGAKELGNILARARYPNHCMSPRVIETETAEVDWTDEHPLNYGGSWRAAVADLFKP